MKIIKKDEQWCVVKKDGSEIKSYSTEQEAKDHIKSIKAVVSVPDGMGLRGWCYHVEEAWEEESEEGLRYSHVRDVFPNYIIVAHGYGMKAKTHKVPYTVGSDNDIEFDTDNMQKVELKTEWVAKSIKMTNPYIVKSIGENKVGGYGIVWGSEDSKDFHDEYFTKDTEELTNIFDGVGVVPFLFSHGGDSALKSQVLGKITKMEADDVGLWYEAQITNHDLYKKYVSRLIGEGKLYSSSGTLPAAKAVDGSFIKIWPIAEISGTTTPADFHQIFDGHNISEIKSYYKSLGIENLDVLDTYEHTNKNEDLEDKDQSKEIDTTDTDAEDAVEEVDTTEQRLELARTTLELEELELELVEL